MKTLKSYLQAHPQLLVKYVSVGTKSVDFTLRYLNKIMRHLLVLQNVDPNSQPGEKFRQALCRSIDKVHKKDFDDDYDFSWTKKCFEKVREQMNHLSLTKQKYWDLTNLSLLDSPDVAEAEKRELKITVPEEPSKEIKECKKGVKKTVKKTKKTKAKNLDTAKERQAERELLVKKVQDSIQTPNTPRKSNDMYRFRRVTS